MADTVFNPFRIIPVLLLENGRLVKTTRFAKPSYVGDVVNSVRIFNEKEVDELVVLDIGASKTRSGPNFEMVKQIADECFMPLAYGGGISTVDEIQKLIGMGIEKVVINTAAMTTSGFVSQASAAVGSQSVVISVDVKKELFRGYQAQALSGTKRVVTKSLSVLLKHLVDSGAGEIFLNNIDRDGTLQGYDHELLRQITSITSVPVISCGGAANVADIARAVAKSGAAACAAGALFTYRGPHRAVLLNYPRPEQVYTALQAV